MNISRILKDKGDSGCGGREERGEEPGQARAEPGGQVALLLQRYLDNKEQTIKTFEISGSAETEQEETSSVTGASGTAANIEEENQREEGFKIL